MASGDLTATKANISDRKCSVFDGVDDVITVANATELNIGTADFSVSYWVCSSKTGASDVISKRAGAGPNEPGYFAGVAGNTKAFAEIDDNVAEGQYISNDVIKDGTWHHIVLTFDRDDVIKCYIDLSKQALEIDISGAAGSLDNALDLLIGQNASGFRDYKGAIRDVRLYKNHLLTTAEIAVIYEGKEPTTTVRKLHGWWKLEDDYTDSSTWGNDGVNTGSYFANTGAKKVLADMNDLNLAAVTDKLICVNVPRRDGTFRIWKAEREA